MHRNPAVSVLVVLALILLAPSAGASSWTPPTLADYLPASVEYDPGVPVPSSVLGFEVGEWHVRHDQLVAYMEAVAASSERVRLEETGRTHEGRRLLLLTITSPENQDRIEEIRQKHLRLVDPHAEKPDTGAMPVVTYMGYSVHGNEPSGSNAALLVVYHLAAARGEAIEETLRQGIFLVDPSINPDGLARFAQWANMHRGYVQGDDPQNREHNEFWPSGRGNHYWFDLNRDWLPLIHPSSRARLATFHRWKPNLLTDHHEMGSDSTFFFQPGIPIRKHPLTPERNVELTNALARFHAELLDAKGRLYYTEESFDDFYYGKGSTYPDVNGAVGILFEQASSRGHLQETDNGTLSFPFTVENQFLASLSTIQGSVALRREFLEHQADFYRAAPAEAADFPVKAYVFGDARDPARTHFLVDLLRRHDIGVHALGKAFKDGETSFEPGSAWLVPLEQAQHRLIRSMFERRVDFADTSFYDISAWTLPLAFNLPFAELDAKAFDKGLVGESADGVAAPSGRQVDADGAVAWVFDWDGYFVPRAVYHLLDAELRVRVATQPLAMETSEGVRSFERGAIVVPLGIQDVGRDEVARRIGEVVADDSVEAFAVTGGLTAEGIDLGSPSLRPLELPRPAIVVGPGVSSTDAGHLWQLLDRRYEMRVSLIDKANLDNADLSRYTHLLFVNGSYGDLSEKLVERLRQWLRQGGVVVATVRAAEWAEKALLQVEEEVVITDTSSESEEVKERVRYADHRHDRAKDLISGAIFEVELDPTHPMAYGLRRERLPVFRSSSLLLEAPSDPYTLVASYTDEPLLAGYISTNNLAKLRGTPAVVAQRVGRGTLVRMIDTQAFRGFWYGTDRLTMNALFFGSILDNTQGRGRE